MEPTHTLASMLQRVTISVVTPRKPRHCVVCGGALEKPARGRMPRFCGVACRMAAYRRRRQGVTERLPRWAGPRGRLRLSRLHAFEGEQAARIVAAEQREERRRAAAAVIAAQREAPPQPGPLPVDWMYRPRGG
ncbi:MAG: hypothetical protein NVSMB29_19300 [Candidatus Dormibacteria bacterium]